MGLKMLSDELKRLFYSIEPDEIIFWSMILLIMILAIGFITMIHKYNLLYDLYIASKEGCIYIGGGSGI